MVRPVTCVLLVVAYLGPTVLTEERIDSEVNWKIRREATTNSHVLTILHQLTDVYGPRLTGSPNLEQAGRGAVDEMEKWGLTNGALEPFDFGHPGWLNERLSVHVVTPIKDALVTEAVAWTPGTSGPVTGVAYQMTVPSGPTATELDGHLAKHRDAIRGKVVLVGEHVYVPVTITPSAARREESALRQQFQSRPQPPSLPGGAGDVDASEDEDPPLGRREVEARVAAFLREAGALIRVNDAGRPCITPSPRSRGRTGQMKS
jgi:hypothetical protein